MPQLRGQPAYWLSVAAMSSASGTKVVIGRRPSTSIPAQSPDHTAYGLILSDFGNGPLPGVPRRGRQASECQADSERIAVTVLAQSGYHLFIFEHGLGFE